MKIPPSLLPVLLLSLVLNFAPRAIAEDAKKPAGLKATTTVNVTPDVAAQMMKEKAPVLVLDVRTPDEFAEGHIPGAMNVDFLGDDFEKKLAALPADDARTLAATARASGHNKFNGLGGLPCEGSGA
jgi:3-mercaptopyruvate sulfurtransferase SseA